MNATSLLEVLNVPVAVTASSAQVPAQPVPAFKESLVAACQASLDVIAAHLAPTGAKLQQNSVAVADLKLPSIKSKVTNVPSLVVAQPPLPAPVLDPTPAAPVKQPPLIQTAVVQEKLVQSVKVPSTQVPPVVYPAILVASTKPTIVRATVANPHSRAASALSQVESILTPAGLVPHSVPDQPIAVVSLPQNKTGVGALVPALKAVASAPVSKVLPNTSILAAESSVNVVPISTPAVAASSAVDAAPTDSLHPVATSSANAVQISTPIVAASTAVDAAPTDCLQPVASSLVNAVPISTPTVAASAAVDAAPTDSLQPVASSSVNADRSVSPSAPAPNLGVVSEPNASFPSVASSTPVEAVVNPHSGAVSTNGSDASAAEVPIADASATPSPLPAPAPDAAFRAPLEPHSAVASSIAPAATKPLLGVVTRAVSDGIARLIPATAPSLVKDAAAPAAPAVPRTEASLPLASAPIVHDAVNSSATREAIAKTSPGPTVQVDPPAASPGPDTGAHSAGALADPLVASLQLPLVTAQATIPGVLTANSKDGVVKAISDGTVIKQHVPAVADQDGLQTGSQATPQPGDQNQGAGQGGAPQQEQSTTMAAANFVNHTIAATVDNAQSAAVGLPPQNAATLASPAGHSAKTPESPAATGSALPQPLPVVNTARLIQTVGQSEMRVGMRSNDFGNISISTSATRDVISAQISLEHSELARTLAMHVPEMQARLGGNQAMDVRIDMNSQATGQGAGTSSGMPNPSGDGSRGEHQPRGNAGPTQQSEKISVTATAAIPPAEAALNARLDIRV